MPDQPRRPVTGTVPRPPAGPDSQDADEESADTPRSRPASAKVVTLGDYRLIKKLGSGGMGTVFQAIQLSLQREVAVKVLAKPLAANPAIVERFYREARLMARLDHPHIVRGYGVGEERGFHYCAMEYIDGASLQDWLKKLKKFSVSDALHVALACARALAYAHGHHLIHRDIKPDNILITRAGVVKVADLGLAKTVDDDLELTKSGIGAGTPYYMSPEQARNAKHVDHRSDLYALGGMLYALLTGQPPFRGASALEVVQAKEEGKFPPARRFNVEVPERLDLIIDKCLAKNPDHRYQSAEELIKDLEALGLANERLSFIAADTSPAPANGPAPRAKPPRPAAETAARRPEEPAGDWWYVKFRTDEDVLVTRKLTTGQVVALIKDELVDVTAQASRRADGDYRGLATYREFEPLLRGRLAKAKAERKAAQFRSFYEKIVEEEERERRWRRLRRFFRNLAGSISFLVYLATLTIVGYLGLLLFRMLFRYIANKLGGNL